MELTVLVVPDCPHAELLEQRLAVVLAGRPDVTISRRVIADAEQAQRWSMLGSPTLLIDGVDPFARSGQPASLSCRLYPSSTGKSEGAPAVSALRAVIEEAGDSRSWHPVEWAVAVDPAASARDDGARPIRSGRWRAAGTAPGDPARFRHHRSRAPALSAGRVLPRSGPGWTDTAAHYSQ
jgi:hypothetical protein